MSGWTTKLEISKRLSNTYNFFLISDLLVGLMSGLLYEGKDLL